MASRGLGKQQPPLWSLPVSQRPPLGLTALLTVTLPLTIGFIVVFDVGILATVLLLVLLYPLYYGSIRTRRTYRQLGKLAFGRLLVLIVNWFSPTELVLSAGRGIDQGEGWIERDSDGNLLSLKLPDKALWISNHTTLTDWIYLWILAYLSRDGDHSASLFISLKSSLRRIPIVGSACQLFGFIFMARKWATDKEPMARQLDEIARENARVGEPMALLLFPEGTIVTANTRGISKKYAEKTQIADFKHLLLPRSTGLFFALRQLARTTPSLRLVDITVGYPLPRSSPSASASPNYASDFYTLPSVLLSHVAPPELHMHIRAFALSEIPLGDLDASDDANGEGTEDEKRAFERWLYDRWAEKDALLERFRTRGTFVVGPVGKQDERGNGSGGGAIGLTRRRRIHDDDNDDDSDDGDRRGEYRWPISLRQPSWEIPAAFQFGWPFLVAYLLWAHRRGILASIVSFLLPVFGRLAGNGQVQSSGKTDL